MVNVYDLAHELARSLKETDQYKNYAAARAKVDAQPEIAKMVNDFQDKNMEAQTRMMIDGKPDEEAMQKVQQLYAIVAQDPTAAGYFAAEMAYTQVVSEIYGILGEAVRLEK